MAWSDSQLMEIVADESERINSIVTHFLNFARPSELRLDSVDLGLLVEETALLAQRDARCSQAVEVEVNLPDRVLELRGEVNNSTLVAITKVTPQSSLGFLFAFP